MEWSYKEVRIWSKMSPYLGTRALKGEGIGPHTKEGRPPDEGGRDRGGTGQAKDGKGCWVPPGTRQVLSQSLQKQGYLWVLGV